VSKQAYLISGYCEHTCSECGVKYTDNEYFRYYTLAKIMQWHINCKNCGAVFHEEPKRCYWDEHYPEIDNGCGECITLDGIPYCARQLTARKRELQSWGCYYSCECYKPLKKPDKFTQLSFFEE
jgi:hypothetical protein